MRHGCYHRFYNFYKLLDVISFYFYVNCIFIHSSYISEKSRVEDKAPGVGSFSHPSSMRFLTYEELKEATHNFEAASILGEGGFGRVYKGVLSDGTAVAIKRLSSGGQQGDKEFLVEVEMLSRLHHRNLIKLVGYYCNRDSSQNLLCYELVPNGSLEAWLHGNHSLFLLSLKYLFTTTCRQVYVFSQVLWVLIVLWIGTPG